MRGVFSGDDPWRYVAWLNTNATRRVGYWMILTLIVCVGGSVGLSAQTVYTVQPVVLPSGAVSAPDSQPAVHKKAMVTLTVRDSSIAYVVNTLVHQAGYRVFFDSKDPMFVRHVTVQLADRPLMEALATVLHGTGLIATLASDGETVIIQKQTAAQNRAQGAAGVVTGRVTDSASGAGVNGATVAVTGTPLSAMTDARGQFTITAVPAGKQFLTVKVFGYKAGSSIVTVTDSTRAVVRITLVPVATVLSGVVTTATGVQSKLSVGSDITTINVDSVMKTAPISSVTDLLENRVPGLTVVHTSGTPGDPSRLLLRGAASVNGSNNPIVVVDGVRVYDPDNLNSVQTQISGIANSLESGLARPSPLDQIDPNTIATIEVMKGPSASALYGSDAANGVIVITTKKGQPGQTHWSVSATQGVSYIPGSYPELTYAFGHFANAPHNTIQCAAGQRAGTPCIIDSVRTFQALNDPRFSPLTSGPLSRASATVSGGAQALTYSFTGSASNTHGMTKLPIFAADQYIAAVGSAPPGWMRHPDDYVSWNGSGQIQASLSPTASITVSDMLNNSTQHRTSLGLSAIGDLIDAYVDTTNIANTPEYTDFLTQITQATVTSTTNATLQWRIQPWLPLTVTGGYNRNQETDKQSLPAGLPSSILPALVDSNGHYELGTLSATVATLNANTTIPISLGRGPGLQLALGTNFVSQSIAGQDINTLQVPVGVSDPTSFSQTGTTVNQQTQSSATYGWFFEPQVQLHSRFYITPGIRLDGGTASGNNAGLIAFPKTNVSYIALDRTSETGGSGWSRAVSLLRLRGAFGLAGVQPQPGQALRLFNTPAVVSTNGGASSTDGTIVTTIGNTLLHPERSREMEAGFDMQFFQNRATLTTTYYNKLRIDAIEAVSVAPSVFVALSGSAVNEYENVGNIRNSGVEMTGALRVLDRNTVTWNITGSISTNHNRVLSAPSSTAGVCNTAYVDTTTRGGACVRAGYPLNAKFVPKIVGYTDLNHDGVIEQNEILVSDSLVYAGNSDPSYTASFGTTLTLWKGRLSLAVDGDYQNGLTIMNQLSKYLAISAANQPGADVATQIAGVEGLRGASNVYNFFQTINALRWDDLSINLTLPTAVARAVRAQQVTLSLQGSNLGLWTNYLGKDPLATGAESGLDALDNGGLPLPRTWQLAVRITQ